MESGPDPVSFPFSFFLQQPTGDPSVMGLLPVEFPSSVEVSGLDHSEARIRNLGELAALRGYRHPVHRGLVGVEGKQRRGSVGLRGRFLQKESDLVGRNLELFDPNSLFPESFTVVSGEVNLKRAPLAVTPGDPHFAGLDVQVKGLRTGAEKEPTNVGDFRLDSVTEAATMAFGQREGDARGDDGMFTGELMDESSVAGKPRESLSGGLPGEDRLSEDLVGQQSVGGHEGEEGGGKGRSEGDDQATEDGHERRAGGGYNDMSGPLEGERCHGALAE
jgi:hypothetical protein